MRIVSFGDENKGHEEQKSPTPARSEETGHLLHIYEDHWKLSYFCPLNGF